MRLEGWRILACFSAIVRLRDCFATITPPFACSSEACLTTSKLSMQLTSYRHHFQITDVSALP